MIENKSIIKLNPLELEVIDRKLRSILITGKMPSSKIKDDPFLNKEYDLIVEYHGNFTRNYEQLLRVINDEEKNSFYLLRCIQADGLIIFKEGYSIFNDITRNEFIKAGNELGYSITGIDFIACDESFSWCILTDVEFKFVTGDIQFMNSFYLSEKDKIEVLRDLKKTLTHSNEYVDWIKQLPRYRNNGVLNTGLP